MTELNRTQMNIIAKAIDGKLTDKNVEHEYHRVGYMTKAQLKTRLSKMFNPVKLHIFAHICRMKGWRGMAKTARIKRDTVVTTSEKWMKKLNLWSEDIPFNA